MRLRRVVSNTVISLIGQFVTWTSTLFLTIAYGRFLGDVRFGELYFAISFVALVGFPLEFGFNQQLTRDVAQDLDKALHYLGNVLLIKSLLWCIFYGLLILLCWLLGYSGEERLLVAISGVTLLSASIANTFASLHYAFERVMYPVIGTILEKGLSALIGYVLLKSGAGVQAMAFVLLGGSAISMIWQATWFFRLTGRRLAIDLSLIRKLLQSSIPFLVYGVLGVIYYRVDTLLLSLMTSTQVIGWYGAGYRLFDTLVFLPGLIIGTIMYPVFSKLSNTSEESLKLAIEKTMNLLLFCGIPIAVFLIFAAPSTIGFLYHNKDFLHTIPVLQALAPGLIFLYINSVFTSILMSTHQERKITILAGVALVFNLGLNLFLIPRYQHVGAAAVTSLTELLLMCTSILLVQRRLQPVKSVKVAIKALIASAVMAVVVVLMSSLSLLVILPIAFLVYVGAAALLGTIPKEDVRALYAAIGRKARKAEPIPAEVSEALEAL